MRSTVAMLIEKWLLIARSRVEHGLSTLPSEQTAARDHLLDVWRAVNEPLKLLSAGRALGSTVDTEGLDDPTTDLALTKDRRRRQ